MSRQDMMSVVIMTAPLLNREFAALFDLSERQVKRIRAEGSRAEAASRLERAINLVASRAIECVSHRESA